MTEGCCGALLFAWGSSRSSRLASSGGSLIDRKSIQFSFDSDNTNGKSLSATYTPKLIHNHT